MMVAGIGCRRGCPAEAIVALVREAGPVDALAAPAWKQEEAGLLEAAGTLGLPLWFVGHEALAAVQGSCPTKSATVARATGFASVAEAAALAGGGTLLRPRFGSGWATCAVADVQFLPRNAAEGDHAQHGGGGTRSVQAPAPPPSATPPPPPQCGGGPEVVLHLAGGPAA